MAGCARLAAVSVGVGRGHTVGSTRITMGYVLEQTQLQHPSGWGTFLQPPAPRRHLGWFQAVLPSPSTTARSYSVAFLVCSPQLGALPAVLGSAHMLNEACC